MAKAKTFYTTSRGVQYPTSAVRCTFTEQACRLRPGLRPSVSLNGVLRDWLRPFSGLRPTTRLRPTIFLWDYAFSGNSNVVQVGRLGGGRPRP